jgi:hypothetical protein
MDTETLNLSLGLYRFVMQIAEPMDLPEFKGGVIRGGFGTTFRRLTCYLGRMRPRAGESSCSHCTVF